jgi:hypothetical protein
MSRSRLRMVMMGVIATASLSVVALVALVAVLLPQQVAHRALLGRRSLSAAAMQSSDLIESYVTWAAQKLPRCRVSSAM